MNVKKQLVRLWGRGLIKLPQVIIEENMLKKGDILTLVYGKNYSIVVVVPNSAQLSEGKKEIIKTLVDENISE